MNKIKGLEKLDSSAVISVERTKDISAMQSFIDNAISNRVVKIFNYVDSHFNIDLNDESRWSDRRGPAMKDIAQSNLWADVQQSKAAIKEGHADFGLNSIVRTILMGHRNFYPSFLKAMCHNIQALEKLRDEVGKYNFSELTKLVGDIVRPPEKSDNGSKKHGNGE